MKQFKLIEILSLVALVTLIGCKDSSQTIDSTPKINHVIYKDVDEKTATNIAIEFFSNTYEACGDNDHSQYNIKLLETELEACPDKNSFSESEEKECFPLGYEIEITYKYPDKIDSSKDCEANFITGVSKPDGMIINPYTYQ